MGGSMIHGNINTGRLGGHHPVRGLAVSSLLIFGVSCTSLLPDNANVSNSTMQAASSIAIEASANLVSPRSGAVVQNPVVIKASVKGITLIPASSPSVAGQGHLHVLIDTDMPLSGQVIPFDDHHVHLGKGQSEFLLKSLTTGRHKIILVFTDSSHKVTNPPLTDTITITVS